MEHIEYVSVQKSKKSRKNLYYLLSGIVIGFIISLFFCFPTKADTVVLADAPYIYVADSDDDCPVNDAVPLSVELQEFIWTRCKRATDDYKNYYCFMLGALQLESTFRAKAYHSNDDGSIDRGIGQINSSNIAKFKKLGYINSVDDLYDPFINLECSFYLMNQYIKELGVTESAYYAYNMGVIKQGSNKSSRTVMKYMAEWKKILFGE